MSSQPMASEPTPPPVGAKKTRGSIGSSDRPSRLPGSDELFRRTSPRAAEPVEPAMRVVERVPTAVPMAVPPLTVPPLTVPPLTVPPVAAAPLAMPTGEAGAERKPTGRERHDEKITVYVSNDELLDLEHARLTLKRLGVKADRGRIVRIALTELIGDLERNGESAVLVQRLRAE